MAIRDRITQFVTYLVKQIQCSQGGILIGRVTGDGKAQEITVGSGLTLSGTTLTANVQNLTSGPVRSANGTSSIADGALSIAKTSGLQDALDGKSAFGHTHSLADFSAISSTGGNGVSDNGKLVKFDSSGAVVGSWFSFPSSQSQNSKTIHPLIYPPYYGSTTVGADFESIYKLPLLSSDSPDTTLAKTSRSDGLISYDDIVDVPDSVPLTASKSVANAAARLALSLENAKGFSVVDADTGKSWMLVGGGTPSVSGDWLQLGDRDIQAADIADSTAAGRALLTAPDDAAQRTAMSAQKIRKYLFGPNGGMRAFRAKLDKGQSGALLIISDSTGRGTNSWPYKTAQNLATRYPTARVEYRELNQATLAYDLTVVQAGTERQNWRHPVGISNVPYFSKYELRAQPSGRYIGWEVEVAPTSDASLSGGYPTAELGLCEYGTGSGKGWMSLGSTGRLSVAWYDGVGLASISSPSGTPVPPLVVGTYVRYRCKLDTQNGSNFTATFEYSTNQGATWTSAGTYSNTKRATPDLVVTTAGVGIGTGNGLIRAGYKFSYVNILTGVNFEPICPQRIDAAALVNGAIANTSLLEGSANIYIDACSKDGAGIMEGEWFQATLPTYAWNLLADRNHDCVIINSGHNDEALTLNGLAYNHDALRTLVTGRLPSSAPPPAFLYVSQNPETTPYYSGLLADANRRGGMLAAYAARKGSAFVDVYQAFVDDGRTLAGTLVSADGMHPTAAGYTLWADTLWNNAFLDGTNE